jgi:manganese/zinc/iron transport system permease protein
MNDFLIITTAILASASCILPGCFLMLRKMSMLADAISHAVLPGIVIAYLVSGSRDSFVLLIGAAFCGVLSTYLIEMLHKKGKLQADASIGVIFTWLFAIGVILISAFASQTDLDQDCVLYGEIAYVPLDLWVTGSGIVLGPRQLWITGCLFLFNAGFVIVAYRRLYISTFDSAYAGVSGIKSGLWHYLLMTMVSLTTVFTFETAGAILVIAYMVIPAASAYLLSNRLSTMIVLALIFGILSSISGFYLAYFIDGSVSGGIAVSNGILFFIILGYYQFRKSYFLKNVKL